MCKLRIATGFVVAIAAVGACDICPGDDASTPNFNASAALNVPGFSFIQTCGNFQALSQILDDAQCEVIQNMGSLCGCPIRTETSCQLCGNREEGKLLFSAINVSAEEVAVFDPSLAYTLQSLMPSCEMMKAYLYSIDKEDNKCSSFQNLLDSQCGCDGLSGLKVDGVPSPTDATTSNPVINSCDPCGGDYDNFDEGKVVEIASIVVGDGTWTCGAMKGIMTSFESDSALCKMVTDYAYICGCNNGVRTYLGADTTAKQAVLAWLPRVSGSLSILGSSMIIYDVMQKPQRRKSLRYQLLLGMSIGDIIGAISYCLSTLPIMQYDTEQRVETGVYGARGTAQTCTAQGFFVQLGYVGIFFNLALSTFYLLTVKYGMYERTGKKYRYFFLLPPILVGLALACAGIPFYGNCNLFCHVVPPYSWSADSQTASVVTGWPIILLSIIPLGLVIVIGCTNMFLIYFDFRKQERASQRWATSGNSNNNAMSRSVFWQALLYTGSFLLCWLIYFTANFASTQLWNYYTFWVFLVILNPLMGLCNCLVYFRPRLAKSFTKWKDGIDKRKLRRSQAQTISTAERSGS